MAASDSVLKDSGQKMKRAIEAMQKEFAGVRTGKAAPALV